MNGKGRQQIQNNDYFSFSFPPKKKQLYKESGHVREPVSYREERLTLVQSKNLAFEKPNVKLKPPS